MLGLIPLILAAAPIDGRWLTEDRKAIITIAPCGAQRCGRITRVLAPIEGPPFDRYNPDPKLRNRPIQGLPVLTGFAPSGAKWRGRIYSPEEGKTYRSVLERRADGTLKVEGCILVLCKAQTWTPAR